ERIVVGIGHEVRGAGDVRGSFVHFDLTRDDDRLDLVRPDLLSQVVEVQLCSRWAEQNCVPWNGVVSLTAEVGGQRVFKISADFRFVAETQGQYPMKLLLTSVAGILPAHQQFARLAKEHRGCCEDHDDSQNLPIHACSSFLLTTTIRYFG